MTKQMTKQKPPMLQIDLRTRSCSLQTKAALWFAALSFAVLSLVSIMASATCRVFESRGEFIQLGAHESEHAMRRIGNPLQGLAASTTGRGRELAKSLIDEELSRRGFDGVVRSEIPARVMQMAEEKVALSILIQKKLADYAVIYGSKRVREDGTVALSYQLIQLTTGEHTDRVLQISAKQMSVDLKKICARLGCQLSDELSSPVLTSPALQTAVGIELLRQLKTANRCQ